MSEHVDPRIRRTHERVLRTAQRLICDEGPASVTFGRVSRDSGVSRTTIYRHWESPSDLVAEAWRELTPTGRVPHTDDLRADLVAVARALRDGVESPVLARSLPTFLSAALDDPVIDQLYAAYVSDRSQQVIDRLVAARDAGDIAPDTDPEQLLDLMAGALYYRQLLRRLPTTDGQAEAIVDDVLAIARRTSS